MSLSFSNNRLHNEITPFSQNLKCSDCLIGAIDTTKITDGRRELHNKYIRKYKGDKKCE